MNWTGEMIPANIIVFAVEYFELGKWYDGVRFPKLYVDFIARRIESP